MSYVAFQSWEWEFFLVCVCLSMQSCVQVCVPSHYGAGLGHIFWPERSLGTGCHGIRDQRSYQVSNRKNNNGAEHSSTYLLGVCVCEWKRDGINIDQKRIKTVGRVELCGLKVSIHSLIQEISEVKHAMIIINENSKSQICCTHQQLTLNSAYLHCFWN